MMEGNFYKPTTGKNGRDSRRAAVVLVIPIHEHRYTSTICYYIVISMYGRVHTSHICILHTVTYCFLLGNHLWSSTMDEMYMIIYRKKSIGEKFENTWPIHQEKNHPSRPRYLAIYLWSVNLFVWWELSFFKRMTSSSSPATTLAI